MNRFCYKSTAAAELGISVRAFETLGMEPDRKVNNPNGPGPAFLFDRVRIAALASDPRVSALRPKPRLPRDYAGIFAKRYGNPAKALPDACEALFSLNRYCKHGRCTETNRQAIYDLKNRLVRLLCTRGHCCEARRHVRSLPSRECWSCEDGAGRGDPNCPRCDGTGIYSPARDVVHVAFRFNVGGKFYSWHQPSESVDWPVQLTHGDEPAPEVVERPLGILARNLTEAKRLVEWVVVGLEECKPGT